VWNEGIVRQADDDAIERWSIARRGVLVKYAHALAW
jgi:hypothetical protein